MSELKQSKEALDLQLKALKVKVSAAHTLVNLSKTKQTEAIASKDAINQQLLSKQVEFNKATTLESAREVQKEIDQLEDELHLLEQFYLNKGDNYQEDGIIALGEGFLIMRQVIPLFNEYDHQLALDTPARKVDIALEEHYSLISKIKEFISDLERCFTHFVGTTPNVMYTFPEPIGSVRVEYRIGINPALLSVKHSLNN